MAPGLRAINIARTAAVPIFEVLDSVPLIDASPESGMKPAAVQVRALEL